MKIKSIAYAGKADVFNMEIEDTHEFAIENGVIVHNCYDELRYVCMRNPIAARVPKPEKIPEYDPLSEEDPLDKRYEFYRRY